MQATKTFRPYQREASDAIVKTWDKYQTCIAVVATGGGKTLIAAGTSKRLQDNGRVLFLANRNELCEQPLGVFREQCGSAPALEKAESRADLDSRVVVASVQTLSRQNRLDRFPKDHFRYVFADEAHGATADSWRRIFGHFSAAKVCGITATPFRSDNKQLSDIFQTEAYRKDLFSLVDDGYLVSPDHVDRLSTAISLANVRVKRGTEGLDYDMQDVADVIAPYFAEIAKELKSRHSGNHILAFLPLVYSSEMFVAACRAEGLNAVHVDGEDPMRKEKIEAFKAGKIELLSNSNLLHTGVDFPCCNMTLCLRPTRSKVLYQQIVGRSTRTIPGLIDGIPDAAGRLDAIARSSKPIATIIDPMWLTLDHDLVTPSFLVAQTQEIAEEIQKQVSCNGNSYSLRQANQEATEAMVRRFQTVAQFREGRLNAKSFAAAIKDQILLTYEPVYAWECEPLRKFTKELLEQRGIDPVGVETEGEGREICKAVNRRRFKGLAEIPALAVMIEAGVPQDRLWNLTKEQVKNWKR